MMSKQQGSWAWLGNSGVVSVTSLWMRLATSLSMQAIRNAWEGFNSKVGGHVEGPESLFPPSDLSQIGVEAEFLWL